MPLLIPELIWLLIPFAIVAAYFAAIAIKKGYAYSLGPVLDALALLLVISIPLKGKILDLGGPIRSLNHKIEDSIAAWASKHELPTGRFFEQIGRYSRGQVDAIEYNATATAQSVHNLVHGTIPATVRDRFDPLAQSLGKSRTASDARARREARARAAGIEAGVRDLAGEKLAREHGIDNVRARGKAYTDAKVGRAEGQIAKERAYAHRVLSRRLSLLEKLLGVGAIAGIAVAALTRVFPYWQCSNVRRLMRGVCRLPIGALDWLFTLEFEALIVSDLCDFIGALSTAASHAEPLLLDFVKAEDALIGCPHAIFADDLPIPPLDLAPVSAGLQLAA